MTPDPTTATHPPVIDYERPGGGRADGVFRDGDCLVLRRGTDVSAACLRCGRPAVGPGHVRRLHVDSGLGPTGSASAVDIDGIIGLIVFVLYVIFFLIALVAILVDLAESRQRVVAVGLCDAHQHQYRRRRWLGRIGWATALLAVVVGVAAVARLPRTTGARVAIGIGCGVGAISGIVCGCVGASYLRVRLKQEKGPWMWVAGFAPPVVATHPAWTAGPTPV